MVRSVSLLGVVLILSGCAALKNTPAQDLAWARWKQCDRFPTVQLKEITPSGETWVWTHFGTDLTAWRECDRAARVEQERAGLFKPGAQPAIGEADARGLVRHAYFTTAPPASGTYLRSGGLFKNVPPPAEAVAGDKPVTFFYAVTQVGRVLAADIRWLTPDGTVAKVSRQTVDQTGRPGSWVWRTDTISTSELRSGRWAVELLLDGHPVGRYEVSVSTPVGPKR